MQALEEMNQERRRGSGGDLGMICLYLETMLEDVSRIETVLRATLHKAQTLRDLEVIEKKHKKRGYNPT